MNEAPMVDLVFRVRGGSVLLHHEHALYAAVSNACPTLHGEGPVGIFRLTGLLPGVRGQASLGSRSTLRLRLPASRIADALPLAGRELRVGVDAIFVGVPSVHPLVPAAAVESQMVTIKVRGADGPAGADLFLESVRTRLADLGIHADASVPPYRTGPKAGEPRRRVLRVHGRTIVGYSLVVHGLGADDSLRLQTAGLGGKRRFGCGLFLPRRVHRCAG